MNHANMHIALLTNRELKLSPLNTMELPRRSTSVDVSTPVQGIQVGVESSIMQG